MHTDTHHHGANEIEASKKIILQINRYKRPERMDDLERDNLLCVLRQLTQLSLIIGRHIHTHTSTYHGAFFNRSIILQCKRKQSLPVHCYRRCCLHTPSTFWMIRLIMHTQKWFRIQNFWYRNIIVNCCDSISRAHTHTKTCVNMANEWQQQTFQWFVTFIKNNENEIDAPHEWSHQTRISNDNDDDNCIHSQFLSFCFVKIHNLSIFTFNFNIFFSGSHFRSWSNRGQFCIVISCINLRMCACTYTR